jgi:hypothetical protein
VTCGAGADDRLQVSSPDRQRQPCRIGRVDELPAREPPAVEGHTPLTKSLKLRRLPEDLGCWIASAAASSFRNQARVCGSPELRSRMSVQDAAGRSVVVLSGHPCASSFRGTAKDGSGSGIPGSTARTAGPHERLAQRSATGASRRAGKGHRNWVSGERCVEGGFAHACAPRRHVRPLLACDSRTDYDDTHAR